MYISRVYSILLMIIFIILIYIILIYIQNKKKIKNYNFPTVNKTGKIPKIIHQIWVGGNIPKYRKILSSSINSFCIRNNITYILWDNNILTPGTPQFEYIKPYWGILLRFLKEEKVIWAKIADILRYILLYNFGGCYLDTTFEIVNDKKFINLWELYDSYKFVGCNEIDNEKKFLSNSFFMCKKGCEIIRNLIEKLEYINVNGLANETTGPYFFGNLLKENGIIILKTNDFFPYYPWAKDGRDTISKCYNNFDGIPITVYGKKEFLEFPCKKYDSILINHWSGGTWLPNGNKQEIEKSFNFLIFDSELFFEKYNYYFITEFIIYFLIKKWKLILYKNIKGKKLKDIFPINSNILLFYTSNTIFTSEILEDVYINVIIEDLHFDKDISNLKKIYNSIKKIYARYPNSIKEIIPSDKIISFSHYASPLCYLPLDDNKINKLLVLGNLSDIYPLRSFVIKNLSKTYYSVRKFKGYNIRGDSFIEYMNYVKNINMYNIALCDIGIVSNINIPYILAKIFEIPACNTALLTHYKIVPQLKELGFIENYHYIACDETDIILKLNFWLSPKNRNKLNEITINGNNHVKENFNIEKIYSKFLG